MARKNPSITNSISSTTGVTVQHKLEGNNNLINRVSWSPQGDLIALPMSDGTVQIYDSQTGGLSRTLSGHSNDVWSVAWSPNGEILASGSLDNTIRLWDVENSTCYKTIKGSSSGIASLSWRPMTDSMSQMLAYCTMDGMVYMYNTVYDSIVYSSTDQVGSNCVVSWSPDGTYLAAGGEDSLVRLWKVPQKNTKGAVDVHVLTGHTRPVFGLAWSPNRNILATASYDKTIRIWSIDNLSVEHIIEGHTGGVGCLSFSHDGQLLISKSYSKHSGGDGTIRLWRCDTWKSISVFSESMSDRWPPGLRFHPYKSVLATVIERDKSLYICDIDLEKLLSFTSPSDDLHYTTAKIVLLGESNVGKSWLAMRLAEHRSPSAEEQGTTHGMQVWSMDTGDLFPASSSPSARHEIVLWDMGGQHEYRLVHQLFLHDTTMALILFDPTRGNAALDEVRDWNKRLEKQSTTHKTIKLLVGPKVDKDLGLGQPEAISDVCKECGFVGYWETSSLVGRGINELKSAIISNLDWSNLTVTTRPALFQCIRDEIEDRRSKGEVILLTEDLKSVTENKLRDLYEDDAVSSVTDLLCAQGVIAKTQLRNGEDALVLQLPIIEQYAGSLILAAKNNPRRVPALEERLIGTEDLPLPGFADTQRLEKSKEGLVLECVAEILIQHGLCFRHEGLLIFPSLFPEPTEKIDTKLPHSVSLYYDFTGAIDNIYASLIARLMVSQQFGEGRLWPSRVEFESADLGLCGIRQVKRPGGMAHLDLFFADETSTSRRRLFTRFVEDHLRQQGVEIREHQAIKCRSCDYEISEDIVQENIARERTDVICPRCRTLTLISEGVAKILELDADSNVKFYALRKSVEEQLNKDAKIVKSIISERKPSNIDGVVRILHLSDLHFDTNSPWRSMLELLVQDLKSSDMPKGPIHHLVISGDMTDKGRIEGFDVARQFVSSLRESLGISIHRCIFVPGNHDVHAPLEAYDVKSNASGLKEGSYVVKDGFVLARNEEKFRLRFKPFSDEFFHKLYQKPYPSDLTQQGTSYLFEDTQIQFMAFNSCFNIDALHRNDSGIALGSIAFAMSEADRQIASAIGSKKLRITDNVIRIGVWHHSLAHPQMMRDPTFIGNLKKFGVHVALHGDVHELNVAKIDYFYETQMNIIGGGSFGASHEGRPESTPRHYNLLEISRAPEQEARIRVYVRQQPKANGPWEGWHAWPNSTGPGKVPYFDVEGVKRIPLSGWQLA